MTNTDQTLRRELQQVRRDWRGLRASRGVCVTLAATGAVLLAVVALDNLVRGDTVARALMALALWGTLGATAAWLVVRRWFEERPDDYFALLVERKHPELCNRLINAVQLARGPAIGSARVIEAIVADASRDISALDGADCLDPRPLRRAALGMAGVAALIGLYAALLAPWFWNGLQRVARPTADVPPFALTQVIESSVKPGNVRVPEGASVAIEARVTGRIPASARWWRATGGGVLRYAEVKADPAAPGLFRLAVHGVEESFGYYLTAGDGRSRQYRVSVVKRPRVERLRVTVRLPAYTGVSAARPGGEDGQVAGIAGTEAALELTSTKPLREARLVTDGEAPQVVPLKRGERDTVWLGRFILWSRDARGLEDRTEPKLVAPARYRVEMLDTDGYETEDAAWRTLSLFKDQNPLVAIAAPGRDLEVRPDAQITLGVTAQDDYGVSDVSVQYRVNDQAGAQELARMPHDGPPRLETRDSCDWALAALALKPGDVVRYWATASDRNTITGPGTSESKVLTLIVTAGEEPATRLDVRLQDYTRTLEELLRLQRVNRSETASGLAFRPLVQRQVQIRATTRQLADAMARDAFPAETIIRKLADVAAGDMAEAVRLLEGGRDVADAARAADFRAQSLPVQDRIIALLESLLARMQRNEEARTALRKLAKADVKAHKAITDALTNVVANLDQMVGEQIELADKYERLPKKPVNELSEESRELLSNLEDFQKRWSQWAKGKVDELTKLPSTFVEDYRLMADINRIYEEIEPAASKRKLEMMEIALEDNAINLRTKWLKEDVETWSMFDVPDFQHWNEEEPFAQKPLEIPEMPLPDALEDKIGDLIEAADEVDEETDDVTAAWAGNLDFAGKGQALDGPGSCYSPKAITGNTPPSNVEQGGRGADGRRGKSSGQMVGDTSRSLPGRSTPARAGNERYEPGLVKQEAKEDPKGATGGGKKAGSGRRGVQGGTPPDFVRDMERLSAKAANIRQRAEQVARQLEDLGIYNRRLTSSIAELETAGREFRDLRYDDATRRQRVALGELKGALTGLNERTAVQLSRARNLPRELREELVQGVDEGFPEGYEDLLKSYFRALSDSE